MHVCARAGKHNFGAMEGQGDDFGDAIDEAIEHELEQKESTVAQPQYYHQQRR